MLKTNHMDGQSALISYELAYQDFCDCIISLPEALFISPMNGWSPRDVLAHLIGWNWEMIEASRSILRGEAPAYYVDAPNDYRNINARFVANYSSQSKAELLDGLRFSMEDFERYVRSLSQSDLTASHGVFHYSGRPATVAGIIGSLTGDYQEHLRQINAWLLNARKTVEQDGHK